MTEMTTNFLKILFNEGEQICVSANKYGYHSLPQEALNGPMSLVSPNPDFEPTIVHESDINLIAINPITGFRTDNNVTTFRSFMVEIDDGTLEEQKLYIEESKLPYSVCVFSGNKSLHYAITLDEPLSDIHQWRFYNQWLLNCLPKTDQQIKNPSRSLRFPGNRRKNGKKLIQAMVEMRGRVSQEEFFKWLYGHENVKPIQRRERETSEFLGNPDIENIPPDVIKMVLDGISENRNATWFYVGCRFASVGFRLDTALNYLSGYFQEDKDFKTREWEGCIKSAYKRIHGDAYVQEN
jgi:hypothetical protein